MMNGWYILVSVSTNVQGALLAQQQYVGPPWLILGLRLANERRRYKVTPPLIGWVQT